MPGSYIIEYVMSHSPNGSCAEDAHWHRSDALPANYILRARQRMADYQIRAALDFCIRCRDSETDFIYAQYPVSPSYSVGTHTWMKELARIDWREYQTDSAIVGLKFTPTGEKKMIKIGVQRLAGKLTLVVNARDFHTELDKIGVAHKDGAYIDGPASSVSVATSAFVVSPLVLLKRDYRDIELPRMVKNEAGEMVKTVVKTPVSATYDLSGIWGNPPSFEQLKKLCNSANEVARKILEHYQPIDISVEIHKRVVK